jgi:hypothetical protein
MIILYLLVSVICFDEVRTERFFCPSFLCPSNETTNSIPILTDLFRSVREDACTAEMLGGAQNIIFCPQEVLKSGQSQRKPETLRGIFVTAETFWLPFSFYVSDRISNLGCTVNLTEIIRFIHSKDGKK